MRGATIAALLVALVLLLGRGLPAPAGAQWDPGDEWEGLPEGEGREELFYNCIACHSTAIIQQQRLDRRTWNEVLVWMVDDMGMPEMPEEEHELVLDYLVEHFGRDAAR